MLLMTMLVFLLFLFLSFPLMFLLLPWILLLVIFIMLLLRILIMFILLLLRSEELRPMTSIGGLRLEYSGPAITLRVQYRQHIQFESIQSRDGI